MNPFRVVSLGAGVQSSTMLLMALNGEFAEMPDVAIFADTQIEPPSVYRWLAWLHLQSQGKVQIATTSKGDLSEMAVQVRTSKKTAQTYTKPQIPAFTLYPDGRKGMMQRQCTLTFKIEKIRQKAKKLAAPGQQIEMLIGISTDEADRMRISNDARIANHYPLIEREMSRGDCLIWMSEHGYPQPPRSACVICPMHDDEEWIRLRDEEPESFQFAVEWEKKYQAAIAQVPRLESIPYLHDSRVPLSEVVFDESKKRNNFRNECSGHCGV